MIQTLTRYLATRAILLLRREYDMDQACAGYSDVSNQAMYMRHACSQGLPFWEDEGASHVRSPHLTRLSVIPLIFRGATVDSRNAEGIYFRARRTHDHSTASQCAEAHPVFVFL